MLRALRIQKAARPDDRLAYARVAEKAGGYLATRLDGNKDAIPILEEALEIYRAEHGDQSPELVSVPSPTVRPPTDTTGSPPDTTPKNMAIPIAQ